MDVGMSSESMTRQEVTGISEAKNKQESTDQIVSQKVLHSLEDDNHHNSSNNGSNNRVIIVLIKEQ
jgi:hypothetical protein